MNGRDAQISDPQQRLFMETVWQVLEQAGYPPTTTDSRIGIYAGITNNTYQRYYLKPHWQELLATVGEYRLMTLNEKDFVATHTAYKLNLKGPAVTIQTACSTSLVAVHIACQSLLNFESDLAVSGSASLFLPQKQGYLYQEGMILSPDGHCRAFDAKAQGTFERQRYWIDVTRPLPQAISSPEKIAKGTLSPATVANTNISKTDIKREFTPFEQKIAQIWTQCLGISNLSVDTDFFEVGGDSLLATQLITLLNTQLNIDLDTHSLLQAPTIAELTLLINQKNQQLDTETSFPNLVVKIQAGNPTWKPLILMHPVGGHVYFYRELAHHLDSQLPIYGIRAQGVEGEAAPLRTIPEMVEVYTEALQSFQPHGPYYLGGTSFGGTLAFAIAQELISQGETVAFLALIDTPSPDNMPYEFDETSDILFYLLEVGNNLDLKGFDSLDEEQQLDFYLRNSGDKFKSRKELKIMLQLFKANLRGMGNYQPSVYGGKIHFFLARQRDEFNAKTPAHGWIGLAEKGIEIYSIPGNHITMNKEPNVQYLGECLQECLKHIT